MNMHFIQTCLIIIDGWVGLRFIIITVARGFVKENI